MHEALDYPMRARTRHLWTIARPQQRSDGKRTRRNCNFILPIFLALTLDSSIMRTIDLRSVALLKYHTDKREIKSLSNREISPRGNFA